MPKIIAANVTKAEFTALQQRRFEVDLNDTKAERTAEMKVDVSPLEVNLDGEPSSNSPKLSFIGRMVALLTTATEDDESCKTPHLSLIELFKVFLWFGVRAFGGPVAQIAMMKNELVVENKWVSVAKFNKVYAVYQVLPGPEAMELACYFGYLSRGRIGAFIAGMGFILPGFSLMLLLSYLYTKFGLLDGTVQASFRCIQISVAAIIFRSVHKLAQGALINTKTKDFSWEKGYIFLFAFLTTVIRLNFFITMAVCGIMQSLFTTEHPRIRDRRQLWGFAVSCVCIGFYILYVQLEGFPAEGAMLGGNIGTSPRGSVTLGELTCIGLVAGLVTFGGAYTTLPFVYTAAVTNGGWLTQQQFLDSIALVNMLPAPLVTFVTLVGWIGGGVGGAIVITFGIFLPAFSFTIIGHPLFEALVGNEFVEPFLDGIAASVIGLLLTTAFQFMKAVVITGLDSSVFLLAFCAAFNFTDKYTQPIIIIVSAIAGQALYGSAS